VSPLCRVREVPFSMAVDFVSSMGAYASLATEEAPVKTDRHPALAKVLIRQGSLGSGNSAYGEDVIFVNSGL
jgi:hypothetical protein